MKKSTRGGLHAFHDGSKPGYRHQPGPQVVKGKKASLTNHQRVIMGRCLKRRIMPSDYVRMYAGGGE